MTTSRMPALFLGHGSPMNVLEENDYTTAWRELGKTLPRPKAIVAVSAHWYTRSSHGQSMILVGSHRHCSIRNIQRRARLNLLVEYRNYWLQKWCIWIPANGVWIMVLGAF